MEKKGVCLICDSQYILHVQDVVGRRTKKTYPQTYCMDCQSFFHKSDYHENDEQQKHDLDFLVSQNENHASIQSQLILELITRLPGCKTVLEIGHGTGILLKACRDFGLSATGFEVNKYCHDYALKNYKVDSRLGLFDHTHKENYDLIIALQVFEHIEEPRELFSSMHRNLNADGAIYISVPFVERNQWKFLWTADQLNEKHAADIFSDVDVHITNFSIDGMKKMGLNLGARTADFFVSKDTYHKSPGAYQGMLFQF